MIKFTEKFQDYACLGDSISVDSGPYEITATLEADTDSTPYDADCYSARKINDWKRDEWFYAGVVLSVSISGRVICKYAASLWSIEVNFNKQGNKYLSTVANELIPEAIAYCENDELYKWIVDGCGVAL